MKREIFFLKKKVGFKRNQEDQGKKYGAVWISGLTTKTKKNFEKQKETKHWRERER